MRIALLLLLPIAVQGFVGTIGSQCSRSSQCGRGAFCYEAKCRRETCTVSTQCQEGELCQYGSVNGKSKIACFPAAIANREKIEEYCPGGGSLVVGYDSKLVTCDMIKACPDTHICNPQFGVCCTKLRTCPRPSKAILNAVTGKPIMCQIKFGFEMPCPGEGYCETKTGFCCQKDPSDIKTVIEKPVKSRPWRGQICTPLDGCEGGAACICAVRGLCKCECPAEFGYTVSSDGKTCQRVRRRLREKCKTDMECSAAFSECATGGCRCKRGFQRDGDGGCKPISYKCINNAQPLTQNDKMTECSLRTTHVFSRRRNTTGEPTTEATTPTTENTDTPPPENLGNLTLFEGQMMESGRDDCPHEYYCVPVFDDAAKPGYYKGFCCPSPSEIRPVCPVGEAHESSHHPDYGCHGCPSDHFCHRDSIATDKEICCPKACVSLEDIYHDGQCYSLAYYGDSCHVSAQCVSSKEPKETEFNEVAKLECLRGICSCPPGFNYADGSCQRIMCTIGLRGEPSVDDRGELIRCSRSSDCSQGQMCDRNTQVCCRGTNRCPKDFVETGELCVNDSCKWPDQMCFRSKDNKVKLCCVFDDVYNVS